MICGLPPQAFELTLRAARQLYELAGAADEAVRRSFAINANGAASAPVKTANFWHALNSAENLAAKISKP